MKRATDKCWLPSFCVVCNVYPPCTLRLPSVFLSSFFRLPSVFLLDYSDVLGFDVGAEGTEHFEVDEEHTLGTAFGFEEGAFVAVEETAYDFHAVTLFQFHFVGMKVGDVFLHLGGGVDEKIHLAGGHLQNLELAVLFLVAVGDERMEVLECIELAERCKYKDRVGNEGTLHDDLLPLDGRVGGSHGAIGA